MISYRTAIEIWLIQSNSKFAQQVRAIFFSQLLFYGIGIIFLFIGAYTTWWISVIAFFAVFIARAKLARYILMKECEAKVAANIQEAKEKSDREDAEYEARKAYEATIPADETPGDKAKREMDKVVADYWKAKAENAKLYK
jgi:hypothetical protein